MEFWLHLLFTLTGAAVQAASVLRLVLMLLLTSQSFRLTLFQRDNTIATRPLYAIKQWHERRWCYLGLASCGVLEAVALYDRDAVAAIAQCLLALFFRVTYTQRKDDDIPIMK